MEGGCGALSNEEKKTMCHIRAVYPNPDGDDYALTTDEAELRRASEKEICSLVLENHGSSIVLFWQIITFWCRIILQSLLIRMYALSFITIFNRLKGSHGLRATHSNTNQC